MNLFAVAVLRRSRVDGVETFEPVILKEFYLNFDDRSTLPAGEGASRNMFFSDDIAERSILSLFLVLCIKVNFSTDPFSRSAFLFPVILFQFRIFNLELSRKPSIDLADGFGLSIRFFDSGKCFVFVSILSTDLTSRFMVLPFL